MAMLRRSTVILAKMPLVLRSHLGREAYPNVFHSHSHFSGKAVHKSEMLCVRFYSHSQTSEDKEEEVPFYMKYHPKFMVRKRGSVPLKDYYKIYERAIKAETALKYERAENLKHIIMPLLRTEFEEFEQLYLPAIQLSKQDMIQDLKKSCASFSIPSSIAKEEELSLHYVSMMYILKNTTNTRVLTFKNYLNKKDIDDDTIARVSGIFYKKSSATTRNILVDLSIEDVELGLRKNGINDEVKLSVVKAFFAMQRDKFNELN